jgi:acyl-CoA dehydrogenase-like protein
MESTLLRSRKLAAAGKGAATEISAVFLRDALSRMQTASQNVVAACCDGDKLQQSMAKLRLLAAYEPVNGIALRRRIAGRLLDAERYAF